MNTPSTFAPEVLANLAASQIDRNARVAKMLLDTASKAVTGNVERSAQVAVAIATETTQAVSELNEAAVSLAQGSLAPYCGPVVEAAKGVKK